MGHKSKTEIITNNSAPETVKQMMLATPADGTLVTGVNVQTDAIGVAKIAKVQYRQMVEANIRRLVREVNQAERARDAAHASFGAAVEVWGPPPAFLADLTAVAAAMRKFLPDAQCAAADQPIQPNGRHAGLSVSPNPAARSLSVGGAVVRPNGSTLFNAGRSYPMPDAMVTLVEYYEAAEKAHAALTQKLKEARDALAAAGQVEEEAMAAMAQAMLENSAGGEKMLAAINRQLRVRLRNAGLDDTADVQ